MADECEISELLPYVDELEKENEAHLVDVEDGGRAELWQQYWGKPLEEQVLSLSDNAREWTPTSFDGKLSIFGCYSTLIEKIDMLYAAAMSGDSIGGTIVIGNPGIGKSCFLLYFVLLSLSRTVPVAYYYAGALHLFCSKGVYRIHSHVQFSCGRKLMLCVDTDFGVPPPVIAASSSFVVGVSYPGEQCYHHWQKQQYLFTIVMDTPDITEFVRCYHQNLSPEHKASLDDLIANIGINFREVVHFVKNPSTRTKEGCFEEFMTNARIAASKVKTIEDFQSLFFSTGAPSEALVFSRRLTPKWIFPPRSKYRIRINEHLEHHIRSPLVVRLLISEYRQRQFRNMRRIGQMFSPAANLGLPLGWLFEAVAHDAILEFGLNELVPMQADDSGWTIGEVADPPIDIGQRTMEVYESKKDDSKTTDPNKYYVPAESTNSTFDAFLHVADFSIAFQMRYWDALIVSHPKDLTCCANVFELIGRTTVVSESTIQKRWPLVFVIPKGATFTLGQTVVEPEDFKFYTMELTGETTLDFAQDIPKDRLVNDDGNDMDVDKACEM